MSNAIRTQGTTVKRGNADGPPETFTNIAEVLDFDGPGGEASEIDVSHLTSTAKEFMLGLKDNGELALNVNLIPSDAAQTGLQADHDASTLRNFKLVFVQGTTAAFAAYVKRFRRTGQKDDVIKAAITLRITGDITWT